MVRTKHIMLDVRIFDIMSAGMCEQHLWLLKAQQVADMALQIRLLVSPSLSSLNISLGRAGGLFLHKGYGPPSKAGIVVNAR